MGSIQSNVKHNNGYSFLKIGTGNCITHYGNEPTHIQNRRSFTGCKSSHWTTHRQMWDGFSLSGPPPGPDPEPPQPQPQYTQYVFWMDNFDFSPYMRTVDIPGDQIWYKMLFDSEGFLLEYPWLLNEVLASGFYCLNYGENWNQISIQVYHEEKIQSIVGKDPESVQVLQFQDLLSSFVSETSEGRFFLFRNSNIQYGPIIAVPESGGLQDSDEIHHFIYQNT